MDFPKSGRIRTTTETANDPILTSDLPARTWHGWWLERPKWLRIGVWAALAGLLSYGFVILRLMVGQWEDKDIHAVLQRGGEVQYFWLPKFSATTVNPYSQWRGYEWINAGLWGRNRRHVIELQLPGATDDDLRRIPEQFPQLKSLMLTNAEVSREGLAELAKLKQLQSVYVHDSDIGDDEAIVLTKIPTLLLLGFDETRVTDALIPHLKQMKLLGWVTLKYTNVSPEEIAAWHATRKWVISCETLGFVPGDLYGSFRWSDGRRNDRFHGPAVVGIEGPLGTEQSQILTKAVPSPEDNQILFAPYQLHWSAAELEKFADGDYRFSLKLGDYDAEPVILRIENGKPSVQQFEFQMPVTRKEALGESP